MDAGIEHGVLAFEFDNIRSDNNYDEQTAMVQFRRSHVNRGRIVKIVMFSMTFVLLMVGFLAIKSDHSQVKEQAVQAPAISDEPPLEGNGERIVDPPDEGSRTFELELAMLEGLNGSKGSVIIKTMPAWAPLGVKQFHELVDSGFYQNCRFFRVVPNFMVQFGISGDPSVQAKFTGKPILDDKVLTTNARGTVTFATSGPNTRTTQLFINTATKGNAFLDKQGFSPFAQVLVGIDIVDKIFDGYREKPNQGKIVNQGNEYLEKEFPKLSWISSVTEIMH